MERRPDIRALLFDLGNVIVRIDFERALAAWQPHSRLAPEALRAAFCADEPYQRHETGALDSEGYFAHLRERLQLGCAADRIRDGWNALLLEPIEQTLALVDQLRARLPCYVLSNTNPAHIAHLRAVRPGLLERFDGVFLSHEIGCRKPEPQAFAASVRAIGVPAGQVLFFDDLAQNVEAARACGLEAALVTQPDDVRRELAARGLV